MLKDNVLYHVTRAIPAGGDVTVGTNVEIAPLGNAVAALNSKTTVEEITATRVQDSTGGSCYVSKIGKICIVTLSLKTNASLAANTVIFSDLPNASRNGFISVLDSVGNYNLLNIKTDGTIVLVSARSSIGWLYTIFAYCAA
jgi:hypothetical protein